MMLSDAAMAHRMERRLYWPEREVVAEPVTRGYSRRHCKGIPANHRHPQSSDRPVAQTIYVQSRSARAF